MPAETVPDGVLPDEIAVALDDRVRGAMLEDLVREERGVNAAEDDPGAALARQAADLVAAPRVAGVDADADDVTLGDR